jgi:hypothetical protein
VALLAALAAAGSGYQVAIMAPTEILAQQHYLNMQALLETLRQEAESLPEGEPRCREAAVASWRGLGWRWRPWCHCCRSLAAPPRPERRPTPP